MEQKKYWQNFSELNNSESFQQESKDEFREELPFEGMDTIADAQTPRRDFLKYVGFSTAAAAIAAGCEVPVKKAIPYLNKPQDLVPGVADYYASTFVSGTDVLPIIAKVRDGRPIKIEGNDLSSLSKGASTAHAQASVLDLYDTARLRYPMADGKEVSSLEAFDKMVGEAIAGAPLVLLTSTIASPTTKDIITAFLAKYPGSRHVQYDGVNYSGLLLAAEAATGKKAIPTFRFEKAKVLVSLAADFLGTWLSPLEFQQGYGALRKVDPKNPGMSKHYQFESMMSMTGANADERFTHKPSESGAVALALLNAVSGQPVSGVSDKVKKGIEKAAKDLLANKGAALVVSGSNDVNIQIVVNAINNAVGAFGATIDTALPMLTKQGVDADMAALVTDMEAGKVGALLLYNVNPAYDYYDAAKFKEALKKIKTTVSFNEKMDETTELCKFVLPAHHYLESWGDVEFKPGFYSFLQPTINPLFKTRQLQDTLLKWSGNSTSYHDYLKQYWINKVGSELAYDKVLMSGVIEPATGTTGGGGAYSNAKLAEASSALSSAKKGGKYELVLYQKVAIGEGRQPNNPWLLELADPITRATWDNYVMISPALGKELLGIDITNPKQSDTYEVHPDKPVVKLKTAKGELLLPAMIVPGMEPDTLAVALGFGRSPKLGKALVHADGNLVGKNAYVLLASGEWMVPDVSVEKTDEKYKVAHIQTHSSYEGRKEVVKELTLEEYKKDPTFVLDKRVEELKPFGGLEKFDREGTIYPKYENPGLKWGMSIDLNSCYGCGACVVACQSENNVAVVGKSEVLRWHDMEWLRIDRYFASTTGNPADADSIQTIFMPMLCQHCDNAPCENVCPVAATMHNSEGINQMAYNRCIGTRYCANNCPYKVRRFNFADYTGADSFMNNQLTEGVGALDPSVLMMNDDLTRMVLNPDVTVRSRGVMEKCSFCVQRLQDGKLKAKKENRTLVDSDAKTACQQACAAGAIVFGNVNNPESGISQTRQENKNRLYYALEQLHTLPNVNYLAKVRNSEEINTDAREEPEEKGTKEKEAKTPAGA